THRLPPFGLGTLQIARFVERNAHAVVGFAVFGVILDHGLQRCAGILQVSAADLHLAAINQSVVIVRAGLQELIIELACVIEAVFLDQKLDVVFLDLNIFGMLLVEGGVFGGGFVQVASRKIEVTQHAVARRVAGKVALGLFQKLLRLGLLSFGQVQTGERSPRFGALGIHVHSVVKLLF